MINMIAAVSLNGVMGKNNQLPWNYDYPEDLKFFRQMTVNKTIVMGKKTLQSIGRALPKRKNIVISNNPETEKNPELWTGVEEVSNSLRSTLQQHQTEEMWLIGGAGIYSEGLQYADTIYLTTIPKIITGDNLIYFPFLNPELFIESEIFKLSKELNVRKYTRHSLSPSILFT